MTIDHLPLTSDNARCGLVALLGVPNAGKSTLTNALVGEKVSIVTHKVQTTRQRITGIAMHDRTQLVLLDTPGLFDPKARLDRAMVQAAKEAGRDADMRLLIIDATIPLNLEKNTRRAYALTREKLSELLEDLPKPLCVVLNKTDEASPSVLMEHAQFLNDPARSEKIDRVFMISALTGDGVEDLKNYLCEAMPESPYLYPPEQLSNMSERLIAAEITREQLILQLHQELPYEVYVETESFEHFRNGDIKIAQLIAVSKAQHKAIVLGHKGARIRSIREKAQKELFNFFGCKIHLFLHIKLVENWQEKRDFYNLTGLNFRA